MQKREGTLRRELSFIEAIALSIGIMAPTAAMALNGSLAAGITGSAVPLAFLLAAVAVGLASFSFIQFSRYFAHSGSVYGFNGVALGPRAGFFSGWALLGTYLAFTGASTAEIGNFAQAFFASVNVSIDWLPLALVSGVLIWGFAYSAIALSTRLTLVMEGVSVLLILVVTVVILSKVGSAGHLTAQPFNPANQPLSSVGLAAVFGFLSFAGFEGAATLAEETRNPRRNIPIALFVTVIASGLFFTFVAYCEVIGFGADGIKALGKSEAPLNDLALRYASPRLAIALDVAAAVSCFSGMLGPLAAAGRVLFALGRGGLAPALGAVHRVHGTPAPAVALSAILVSVPFLLWAPFVGAGNYYSYASTIGVLALIAVYISVGAAETVEAWREQRFAWSALCALG